MNRKATAIVTIALAAIATGAVPVAASAAPAPSYPVTGYRYSAAEQRAALNFWTLRRMAAARPADVLRVSAAAARTITAKTAADPYAGHLGAVSGGRPARGNSAVTDTSFNVPANLYTQWPYRVNGKIFFIFKGSEYVCSGTSVASYHGTSLEDEVWTAGHCIVNTDQQSPGVAATETVFVPAYNGTAANPTPFGTFLVTGWETTRTWEYNADPSEDEAALEVGRNGANQTLGQAVGYEGFTYNQSDSQFFTAFGYPAASPYSGNLMVEDIASTAYTYRPAGAAGQPMIGIANPMTGGSSGGGWDIDWSTSSPGYLDGHNDLEIGGLPGIMFSPYQDSLANAVRCFGKSTC